MASKPVRPWNPGQPTLLPTDLRRWLDEDHLVWFVLELVERLDLSRIEARLNAKDPRGTPPYDPRMMVALLIYAYAVGTFSSRKIERATQEDVAFRVLTADQHPDHDTIAAFRRENLAEFQELFVQVLRLAGTMGLVKFGVLAIDGVKVMANASKHQAMSYDRMKKDVARLNDEIARLLARAEQVDTDDKARFGDGRLADLPAEIARREARKTKIEEAMAALEAEARAARAAELSEQAERHAEKAADESNDATTRKRSATLARQREAALQALADDDDDPSDNDIDPDGAASGDLPSHQLPHEVDGTPKDHAQRNFTDPESRIMVRDGDHVVQAFNAQAVVDNAHQIIVAAAVGNQAPDTEYLPPMLARADDNFERAGIDKPPNTPMAGDAGYFSESNVVACERRGYDPHLAPERIRRERPELATGPSPAPAGSPEPQTPREKMRAKLNTPEGRRIYGLRKTTPEPVFGQILSVRGFRRFLLRGLQKARGEWDLVTATHNILKLWRSGIALPKLA